jgi:thiaminase/transcriptional activator TenA
VSAKAATDLFARLQAACADEWRTYVEHPFVRELADGSLPEACFKHYLTQDYLFLVHFARAYALAAYKGETLADIRQATEGLAAIVDVEMGLHVKYCAGWGLNAAAMTAAPEAEETLAYSRYVLERGLAGDLLDLHVALSPCIVGYAEIGRAIKTGSATMLAGNPYRDWIEMYACAEYQDLAARERAHLDSLMTRRGGPGRFPTLVETFRQATRLEAAFWRMGLNTR